MEANPETVTHVNCYVPPPLSPSSLCSVTFSLSVYSQSLSLSLFVSHWGGHPVGRSVSMSVCHIIIHQLCIIIRASISMSLGHPATTFRGWSLIWNGSCAEVFCFAHMMPFDPSTTLFWVQFCRTMKMSHLVLVTFTSFSSTLSGMFVHDSSKRFIQRPILIVLNVYMTLVAGSLPTLQMCFSSIRTHVSVSKGSIHISCGTFKHKIVTKHLFETSQS